MRFWRARIALLPARRCSASRQQPVYVAQESEVNEAARLKRRGGKAAEGSRHNPALCKHANRDKDVPTLLNVGTGPGLTVQATICSVLAAGQFARGDYTD